MARWSLLVQAAWRRRILKAPPRASLRTAYFKTVTARTWVSPGISTRI